MCDWERESTCWGVVGSISSSSSKSERERDPRGGGRRYPAAETIATAKASDKIKDVGAITKENENGSTVEEIKKCLYYILKMVISDNARRVSYGAV